MDQVEVDVVEPEPLEAGLERLARLLVAVVVVEALRGDEDVVAVEPGGPERLADLRLVAVGGGGVNVPVAGLERARDGLGRLAGRDQEDAEAELGDLNAVAEGEIRNRFDWRAHA